MGKNVGPDTLYAAMGGLTDFASLADGVDRQNMIQHRSQGQLEAGKRGKKGKKGGVISGVSAFDLYCRPHRL
jgi:hypothetical protein